MNYFDIIKASSGVPVDDPWAMLWAQSLSGDWPVTELTGELPLIFLSGGSVLVDYRIYGTSEGAGVETKTKIFGWRVDPSVSNPAQAITYLGDAVGKIPAAMGAETFSYGDWSDAFFMPKPCMLKSDGTVDYYLDPNDYTKKADGTASDIADPSYDGNAMMEWPLIWWKYEAGETEGEGYFYVANRKPDDTYHCWCNYDADDNITEHFYTAIYNGTGTDKMRSISGVALTSANGNGGTTATQEITRAKANNTTNKTEWYIDVWSDRMLINGLLILMGKSLNSQAVFGRGLDTGSQSAKEAYVTGSLNDKGLFWGNTSAGTSGVKVFGMENWWGCVWHRTAGLIGLSNGNTAYKLTHGTVDGTTADGYNTTGNGYLIDTTARPANDYFKTAKFGKFGYLPLTTGGSSTTDYSDYWYTNTSALTFALVGGYAGPGVSDGCSSFNLSTALSRADWYISSSLSFKPLAKTTPDTSIIPPGYKLPLTVESGETENIFDANNANIINGYISGTIVAGNSFRTCYVECSPNTTYTIKRFVVNPRLYVVYTYELPQIGVKVHGTINGSDSGVATITTNGSAQYLCVYYYNPNGATYTADEVLHSLVIVKGSTPPDHYIPHRYTSDIPIYIGPTKLGAEEYVDFGEQKVYKRTEQLLPPYEMDEGASQKGYYLTLAGIVSASSTAYNYVTGYIGVLPSESYALKNFPGNSTAICYYDTNKVYISGETYGNRGSFTVTTPANCQYVRMTAQDRDSNTSVFVKGNEIPETRIPYLQSTDLPVPLPPIPTYKGENTLSSTETLGEVTVKGRIKEIE